jgi:uncharacterized protein involved in type VI secretion and phage assembly
MTPTLAELLQTTAPSAGDRIYGIVTGVVTNIDDPDGLARVRVRFPWLSDDDESWWAPVATPMAGAARGAYFLPEVDEKVLVAFEHGDPRFPYVIGSVWQADAKPPLTPVKQGDDVLNDVRAITSRSGHVIRLDDTKDKEKVEIVTKDEKVTIVLDAKDGKLTITSDSDVAIESTNGKLTLTGGKGVEIVSKDKLTLDATGAAGFTSKDAVTVKGTTIDLN